MERLVIIDHVNHNVFIEDVTDEMLKPYNGEEEDYIKDNYDLESFSWDYVVSMQYVASTGDVFDADEAIDALAEEIEEDMEDDY